MEIEIPSEIPLVELSVSPTETRVEKADRFMSLGRFYRISEVHQIAAQTLSILALVEVTAANTLAVDRHAAHTAELVDQAHLANLLTFYALDKSVLPVGVEVQLKAALGIEVDPGLFPAEASAVPVEPLSFLEPALPFESDPAFDGSSVNDFQ